MHSESLAPGPSPPEAESTVVHPLWSVFPGNRDMRILLPELLRTSRYTYQINIQPHSKLTHEMLRAPYIPEKSSNAGTHPVLLAKRLLLFAITLQGPSVEFSRLSEPPSVLSRRLVTAATTWLSTQDETHCSVESLICIILQAVFETNCGNLCRAWVIYRKAMTIAQTMGLHRSPLPPLKRLDPALDADPSFMWFRIVYMDRYLSLLLGLPQGTTDKSMGTPATLQREPPLGQFERQLTAIASCILERNDRAFTPSEVLTTKSIDEELLRASENMPASFWRPANFHNVVAGSPENLLETIRLAVQVYYYGLLIQLHLPYMMHGSGNGAEHEYSKVTCVNASREIILRFIAHRGFQPKSSCSRPVDFFALLAAMTLLLAHLDAHYHRSETNFLAHQRLSDRAMLDQALDRMDVTRDANKDIVMEDSGKLIRQLLEVEADAANGGNYTASSVSSSEEGGEVQDIERGLRLLIPYLGTIKITRQGPISREPLSQDNNNNINNNTMAAAGSRLSDETTTPCPDGMPYLDSTRAALNDAFAAAPISHHHPSSPANQQQQQQPPLTKTNLNGIIAHGNLQCFGYGLSTIAAAAAAAAASPELLNPAQVQQAPNLGLVGPQQGGSGELQCRPITGLDGNNTTPTTLQQQQRSDLQNNTAMTMTNGAIAADSLPDGDDDWTFQGVDVAFFDSLMRGYSEGAGGFLDPQQRDSMVG